VKYHILVGTHHKTGTVWMARVFRDLAKRLGAPYIHLSRTGAKGEKRRVPKIELAGLFDRTIQDNDGKRCIFMSAHSRFPMLRSLSAANNEEFRGIHVIRDPRDLCISAARYHGQARERWLHVPRDEFGGLTYQQAINQRETLADKIEFEMGGSAKLQIAAMDRFDRQSVFWDVKYEDLISDRDMLLWHRLFVYLGLEGKELAAGLDAVWGRSLFGDGAPAKQTGHIVHGGARQWTALLDTDLLRKMNDEFGAAIASLGYGDAEEGLRSAAQDGAADAAYGTSEITA
jgi:hypothetical protein